ncbi:MAG TPA: carboxyl transferase domain-containing protein [Capillimicrobium sp.]|nr:carboxyl transferase domain-containing protein [Capillimicrobium sp.]
MSAAEQIECADTPIGRLESLVDPGTLHLLRTAVGDGVVAGSGRVDGRPVFGWAQDGRYRGGSLGARGGETIQRVFALADRAGAPVVCFPESGGARVQEGVAALTAYGAIFRAEATARVPVISIVAGACAGGAAYGAAVGDLTISAGDDVKLFLTGPRVVEEITRERVSAVELGGVRVQSANGVIHLAGADGREALELARRVLGFLPGRLGERPPVQEPRSPAPGDPGEVLPPSPRQVYDVRDVAHRILDDGELLELAPRWARNLVVGLGRVEGMPVGVIANQPKHLGGTLDVAAAEKGAWFVEWCDRMGLPLAVLVDTPGFLPGTGQERAGVIRYGAGFLRAFARATVPRVTVTLRQAFGGAHIVMNSRDLGADLTLAWSAARMGVMGARQAVEVVGRRELAAGADRMALEAAYEIEQLDVRVSARDGFVDEVIEPRETRARIAHALGAFAP